MVFIRLKSNWISFVIFLVLVVNFSCAVELVEDTPVYSNDFSSMDLDNLENGRFFEFNEEMVIGSYNSEEVSLNLSGLPKHNTLRITIELLVHDSWDGNVVNVGGPDFWYMKIDGQEFLRTTFSNSACNSLLCLYQSYPENHIRQFEPKTGAIQTNLPGLCQYKDVPGFTSKYSISKLIMHSGSTAQIIFGDELKQENSPNPICDESWSINKIEINALSIN